MESNLIFLSGIWEEFQRKRQEQVQMKEKKRTSVVFDRNHPPFHEKISEKFLFT